jgi:hypothetical protein
MKTGAELISEERNRQIEVEGYDKEHDSDEYYHDIDAFVKAAVSYAIIDLKGSEKKYSYAWWPWDGIYWKPKDRLRNLVRAGALIAAAIDKLQNNEEQNDGI